MNANILQNELIPEVVHRYFGSVDRLPYKLAVVSAGEPPKVIYRSEHALATEALSSADARTDLLSSRPEDVFRFQSEPQSATTRDSEEARSATLPSGERRDAELRRGKRPPPILLSSRDGRQWQLVVQHRSGSLDAAVKEIRHRNLFVSFGVLLLLAVSMAMVMLSTQQAKRLARLQIDFVAGVSHELRTPLTVICSAAENLADGIVDGREQVRQYGTLIRNEGRRLAEMVQQILLFASGWAEGIKYELRPVQVSGVVDRVLAGAASRIKAARFTVERRIDPNLPPLMADTAALV